MRVFVSHVLGLVAGVCITASSLPAQGAAGPVTSFSAEQATRGERAFGSYCSECHTRSDMSNADFRLKWNGRTVFDLFERIRTTMPESSPGSLSRDDYTTIVAYFLKLNGVPAGSTPLAADSSALSRARLDIGNPPQR